MPNSYALTDNNTVSMRFHDWHIFKTKRDDRIICYAVSLPIKQEGNFDKRGEPYFLVTNIANDADEITISSGFLYRSTSDVEISFGSKKFYLFPFMATAWANDVNDDIDIIKQMQKNEEVTVKGITRDNKFATDTYSLIGFLESYAKLKEICK